MVPIWVREPTGSASPFFTSSTPAMKVVATAPIPGINTPSLPVGSLISLASVIFSSFRPPAPTTCPGSPTMRNHIHPDLPALQLRHSQDTCHARLSTQSMLHDQSHFPAIVRRRVNASPRSSARVGEVPTTAILHIEPAYRRRYPDILISA